MCICIYLLFIHVLCLIMCQFGSFALQSTTAVAPTSVVPAPITRQPSTKRAPSPAPKQQQQQPQPQRTSRNLGKYADDDGDIVAEDDVDWNFKLHQRMKTTWDDKDVSQEFADFGDEENVDSVGM